MLYRLKALVYDQPKHLRAFEKQKEENLESLKGQLKANGFGSFTGKLENYLDYETAIINIPMTTQLSDQGSMDVTLKLELDYTGYYRFHEYQASIIRDGEIKKSYTFTAENKVTATEAANLLEGRPVNKSYYTVDGNPENKWMQLDFSGNEPRFLEFHSDYGYDLKKELITTTKDLGIQGMGKDRVVQSLEAGNLIRFEIAGKGHFYLHANPLGRSVNVFDADKKPVELSELIKEIKQTQIAAFHHGIRLNKGQEKIMKQDQSLSIV